MGLVGPYLTTTSYKKRVKKITKSQQEEFERGWRDRNQRLKEMHLPKETFEQYMEFVHGRVKKETRSKVYDRYEEPVGGYPKSNGSTIPIPSLGEWVTGPCSSKPAPTYTGTKIVGISQMHKSNAVPVFSNEEAIEVARMRR